MVECNDSKCPIHGSIKVRGNLLEGIVVTAKVPKTIVIERIHTRYVRKYERFRKVKTKTYAYCPLCIKVKAGDTVKIGETRKLSKTKSFVLLEVVKKA